MAKRPKKDLVDFETVSMEQQAETATYPRQLTTKVEGCAGT